ncbi:MAG: siphovirus ReqiPepy6 Gp37-like family protein [Oscillospiraceae bacterium]|nr:siphovirus ReqiPepy6 Gp37-like family protein [Oscillospiraceae bacterium]
MVLQIFRPPGDNELLQDCKLGDINDAISLEYEKYFCGAGTFTLELSPASPFAGAIEVNSLIYCREDDICWVVKNIKTTAEKVTVTGYDLNGLLLDRLTLPTEDGEAGTEGKDAVSGSTEACVKHFVEYNLISSEMPERNIPRLVSAENMDRGIAQDSYLASKECLEDVVRTMCGGAGLGYRIRLDLTQSNSEPIFIFDVLEQCDRSADQDERNRVIFSEGMRNIGNIERELGITADKNALWCEVGGLDGFVNSGENIPAGWARREEYVSLSVTDPYNQEFVDEAAQKEMSDKFASTDSLTVEAGNPLEYGVVYDVGDIVTVYDREKSAQLNSVISAVTVKRTATEHTVKLTLGESKPKLLDGYAKKTDLLAKTQRAYPAAQASTASAITTYEYLTDSSVKFNDTTYTIEKNEAGLISKITDSLGNSLKPVVRGEITDIALHNAVFMAVAMLSRFGREYEFMPYMSGVSWYYGRETMGKSEWRSMIKGGLSIRLSRASVTDDELIIAAGGSGIMDTNLSGNIPIYVAAANTSAEDVWTQYAGMGNTESQGNGRECTVQSRGTDSGILCTTGSWGADGVGNLYPDTRIKSITDYHLVVMRREGSTAEAFFDGVKASASKAVYDYSPTFFMGGYYRGGRLTSNGAAVKYKFVAISNIAQTDSEILENSRWLMERLNISQQNAVQDVV